MDIKLKSRYFYISIFITSMYLLSFSCLSASDIIRNKEYLAKDTYFNSYSFESQLRSCFESVKPLLIDFKGYPLSTQQEKVSDKEIQALRDSYSKITSEKESEVESQYKKALDEAQKEGNKDKAIKLIEEKDQKLAEVHKENTKTLGELKSEIIARNNVNYENTVKYIQSINSLKYYIKDIKSEQVYTNLANVSDVEEYIKTKSVFSKKFPMSLSYGGYLQIINKWFQTNDYEGYFIVLNDMEGFSQLQEDYKYYNSIRERIVKEAILLAITLFTGLLLLLYLMRNKKEHMNFVQDAIKVYERIPLDLRFVLFLICMFITMIYLTNSNFFYKPIGLKHILKLTVMSLIVFYILINIRSGLRLLTDSEERTIQWKESIINKFETVIKDSFMIKNVLFKVNIIFILTTLFGLFIGVALISLVQRGKEVFLVSAIYIFFYIIFVPIYALKKIAILNKVIKGTNEITSGNLNYFIDSTGEGDLSILAANINNMKEGFKRSVESQVKSERLKSELITNVSHDLKTPLTSIINYINLLKQEGISKEEVLEYIEVLDRKSQRLKLLIEDLFEASKLTSGAVELNVERVDITALIKQALGEFDDKIRESTLTFKIIVPEQKIYLNLDGKKTWRVFENLIGNILKYSHANTRVFIELTENDSKVLLTMKNISAYEIDFNVDEIFDRFKRGDKARNTEGSGLGLAIAKSIVELQGGKLTIDIDGDLFKAIVEFHK